MSFKSCGKPHSVELNDNNPKPMTQVRTKEVTVISIDRSRSFNPAPLITDTRGRPRKGWKILEEDRRSLAITSLDLAKVELVSNREIGGRTHVDGDIALERLKAKRLIRLDAQFLKTILRNESRIPAEWKNKVDNHYYRTIYFDGTILGHESDEDARMSFAFYWNGHVWSHQEVPTYYERDKKCFTACLRVGR